MSIAKSLKQVGKLVDAVNSLAENAANMLAEEATELDKTLNRSKSGRVLTLDACIHKAYADRREYPQITAFIVGIKHTMKHGEDGLEITMAYMDRNRKAITLDGETALAYIYNVSTIDEKLVNLLDGENSAIYEL